MFVITTGSPLSFHYIILKAKKPFPQDEGRTNVNTCTCTLLKASVSEIFTIFTSVNSENRYTKNMEYFYVYKLRDSCRAYKLSLAKKSSLLADVLLADVLPPLQ